MAFKFVIISCLVAMARAGALPAALVAEPVQAVAAPAAVLAPAARLEEFDTYPQYRFGYDVVDTNTGDIKNQVEERNGDLVRGQYSLVQPDGTRLTVDYTADEQGYFAYVRNSPLVAPAVPAVVEPAVVAEPAVVPARIAAAPVPAPATRLVAGPAPVVPRYSIAYAGAPPTLARYAYPAYQQYARFAAPITYPGAPASVVAV